MRLGLTFADINTTLSTGLGSSYVNDFTEQRPRAAGDRAGRRASTACSRKTSCSLYVRNATGEMVPFSSFATIALDLRRRAAGTLQRLSVDQHLRRRRAGPLHGRGDGRDGTPGGAVAARLRLSNGPASRCEEQPSGSQAPALFALSLLVVFLCLAALYESWSIPVVGDAGGAARHPRRRARRHLRGLPNDVYFKVGLIAIIGLSAKNAILIIEFAKDLQARGHGPDRSDAGSGAPALPPDHHDLARLHPRRAAAGRSPRGAGRPASAPSAPA